MTATTDSAWPTHRILFALAGTVTLTSVLLTVTVSRWFLLLAAFVGVNQLLYVSLGACPVSVVIDRLRPTRSPVPSTMLKTDTNKEN